jgi:hypothetical protein
MLYTCVLWKLFGKYFSALFPLFFRFFCVKRPDGVSGRPDGAPVCPDGYSGCPDDTVNSLGHSFFLFGRACFCDLYVALRPDVT